MPLLPGLIRVGSAFQRGPIERDLESYVDELVDWKLQRDVDPSEARRQVLAEMGGLTKVKEAARAGRLGVWLDLLRRDAGYAARNVSRNRSFLFVTVVTLGIGIGSSTSVASVVNAVLLRPLPYTEPDRLALIWSGDHGILTGRDVDTLEREATLSCPRPARRDGLT